MDSLSLSLAITDIEAEARRIVDLHNGYNSAHEAYAVILEEVEEFWEQVKLPPRRRDLSAMRQELIQIAAGALAGAVLLCKIDSEEVE